MTIALIWLVVVLLIVIGWLCMKLSRVHLKASMLSQTVADVLDAGGTPRQLEVAAKARRAMEDAGLWLTK